MAFNKDTDIVVDNLGQRWINIPALVEVLVGVNTEVQFIALQRNTVQSKSAAGVIDDYTANLIKTLLGL